jgi:hypothetical protein
MNNLDLTMIVAGTVLLAALAVVLGWRRAYREYPVFFVYVLGSLLIALLRLSAVRLFFRSNYVLYFKVYWITDALLVFVGLLALYEVFRRVFRAFFSLYSWFWALFPCVIVLVASIATVHALQHPPIEAIPLIGVILSLEIGVNVIRSSIFVLFFVTMWFFKVRRKNYALRIVDGFALIALSGLVYQLRSSFGAGFNQFALAAVPIINILATLLWLYTFIQPPEPDPKWESEVTPQQLLDDIQQYTKMFKKFNDRRKKKR